MCNDDWFSRWIASVLASFTLQSIGDLFYERRKPFNNVDPLSRTDFVQTESPENFMISLIFEILPTDKEWKGNDITYCRPWTSCGCHDRGITVQAEFLSASTTLELELLNCVLFHRTKFVFLLSTVTVF